VALLAITSLATLDSEAVRAAPTQPVLAYMSWTGSVASIYTANLDGSNPTLRVVDAHEPNVSPDGTKMAWTRSGATASQLMVSTISGAGARLVANGWITPDWAPDNRRLVVAAESGLAIVDTVTGTVTRIANTKSYSNPEWSPDGTLIVCETARGSVSMRPDGTARTALAHPGGSWSPDGSMLLASGGDFTPLEVIDTIGGARHYLARGSRGAAWAAPAGSTVSLIVAPLFSAQENAPLERVDYPVAFPFNATHTPLGIAGWYPSVGGLPTNADGVAPPPVTGLSVSVTPGRAHLAWTPPTSTPDFAGVEVRYSLGTSPPATTSDGLDGGRFLTSATLAAVLPPDQAVAISVFARDWSGNIGDPVTTVVTTPRATRTVVGLSATPTLPTVGDGVTLTARVTREYDHTAVTGASLLVQRRARYSTGTWGQTVLNTGPFTTIGTTVTNSSGTVVIVQIPGQAYEYRVVYGGDLDHASATATTAFDLALRVTLDRSVVSAPAGTSVRFTATVGPAMCTMLGTYLEKYTTSWQRLGSHATSNTGCINRVTYTVEAPARGTSVRYRVFVSATGTRFASGTSAPVRVSGT
jgi:hypothetical protein